MPTFTVQRQRASLRSTHWHDEGLLTHVRAEDAVDAAFSGARMLGVRSKIERLLLWEGADTSTIPRIFHSGS
jgi:hypothetical protein